MVFMFKYRRTPMDAAMSMPIVSKIVSVDFAMEGL